MVDISVFVSHSLDNSIAHYRRLLAVAIELEFRAQCEEQSNGIVFVGGEGIRFVLQFVRDTLHGRSQHGIRIVVLPNVGFAGLLEGQSDEDETESNL